MTTSASPLLRLQELLPVVATKKENDAAAFTGQHRKAFWYFTLALAVFNEVVLRIVLLSRLTLHQRQYYYDHILWESICFDSIVYLLGLAIPLLRFPSEQIQIHSDASLVVVPRLTTSKIAGGKPVKCDSQDCCKGCSRRLGREFATSLSGTEVLVAPDKLPAFLDAAQEVASIQRSNCMVETV